MAMYVLFLWQCRQRDNGFAENFSDNHRHYGDTLSHLNFIRLTRIDRELYM